MSHPTLSVSLFVILFTLIMPTSVNAQKFLLVEKQNSLKTYRIYQGQTFSFQMSDQWYNRTLKDFNISEQVIYVDDGIVSIDEITAIRKKRSHSFAVNASAGLKTFAISWAAFSAADILIERRNVKTLDYVVPTIALGIGKMLDVLFGNKKLKMQKQWRLRLVEI